MCRNFYTFALSLVLFSTILPAAKAQDERLKLEILNGHSGGGVLSVAVSSDGKYALTGSTDKTALLWDLETGKQLRRFVGHEGAVNAAAFSRDELGGRAKQIKLLTIGDSGNLPTKKNFENAFSEIAKQAKPEDILVVYLAGHGASLDKAADNYFFLTKDAENATQTYLENNLQSVTISDKEIIDWITQRNWRADKKGIDARKQVLILDTCAAGAFANNVTLGNLRDNNPSPETARDALKPDQIRAMEKLKDLTGFQILMGSSADKSSYESSRYEHGLLTYALLEGMKGAALKQDKFVDTQTLFVHARENVKRMAGELVGGIQDPRIFGESGILIGLMNGQDRDAIKILKSPLPVFVRPNFSLDNGTGKDTLDLTAQFRSLLEQASDLSPRGGAPNPNRPAFVY